MQAAQLRAILGAVTLAATEEGTLRKTRASRKGRPEVSVTEPEIAACWEDGES